MADVLWFDGEIRDTNEVPVTPDAELWRGRGLFETLAVHGGEIYNVEPHLERLKRSLDNPNDQLFQQLRRDLDYLTDEFDPDRGRMKLVYWSGDRADHLAGWLKSYDPPEPAAYRDGVSLDVETSSHPPRWPLAHEKRTSYAGVLARRRRSSAWGVCYCDLEGNVRECGIANVFWYDGNRLLTPPQGGQVLPGTVLQSLRRMSNREDLPFLEDGFNHKRPVSNLYVTNSLIGVLPVGRIDGRPIEHHPGNPVWATLRPQLATDKVIPLWYDE